MQNCERNWKNLICVRVDNFDKSVNLKILRESSQRKILKLSRLEYYFLRRKINFSAIHPIYIIIYDFEEQCLAETFFKLLEKVTF